MGQKKADKPADADQSPGAGHNSDADAEKVRQSLTFQWLKEYERDLGLKKAADKKLKDTCKKANAAIGLDAVDRFKIIIKLRTPEGEEEVIETMKRQAEIARWMGLPVGTEPDMFGDGVDRTPAVDKKRAEGLRHGLAGETCNPGCDASTPQHSAYMEGFHEGVAIHVRNGIKPLEDPKDTSDAIDELGGEEVDDRVVKFPGVLEDA